MKGGIIMACHSNAGRKTSTLHMVDADARLALIHDWLTRALRLPVHSLVPASSDASFRRYFRLTTGEATYIVMDAPPGREDVRPYLKVTRLLEAIGVHVPHVTHSDIARGLLLLEDLGSVQYLARLEAGDDPDALYGDALAALARIQVHGRVAAAELAPYGTAELGRELALMPEWFLGRHLRLPSDAGDSQLLAQTFDFLIAEALAQPTVFVHRDYHSRNLMQLEQGNPGIIDFQDALRGPIAYDLVSLLKDCYIAWPRARVVDWVGRYRRQLLAHGGEGGAGAAQFLRWFDLVGVQRHLKVLGIFCRLWYRDGKSGYLADLPRTYDYVRETCAVYPELAAFGKFLEARVTPHLAAANAAVFAQQVRP